VTLLRQTVLVVLILVLLLLAVPVSFMALNIPIDLGLLKKPLANAVSSEIGMDVRINGDMRLVPGLEPTFEMQGLEITGLENPGDGDTISLGLARVQLDLLALIVGGIRIEELTAEDIRVVAVIGRGRGTPTLPAASQEATKSPAQMETANSNESVLLFKGLANLALRRISVDVREADSGKQHRFVLDEMTGGATANQPLELKARGRYQGQPFRLDMRGESVDKILLLQWSWPLDLRADIAGMRVELSPAAADATSATGAAIDYRLRIAGKRLDELDEIVGVSLPPLGPYSVAGRFSVFADRYSISDIELGLGESDLRGSLELDVAEKIPRLKVDLTADGLRLEDFDTGAWSPVETSADSRPADAASGSIAPLFEPEVLKSISLRLSLAVKKVRSRVRKLGSGSLELRLEDGIISLDPLNIELPQGPAAFTMVLDPGSRSGSNLSRLLPVSLSARVADTVLRFERDDGGAAAEAEDPREFRYRMRVQGRSLDSFDDFAGVSLPPLGPYELTALITARDTRYALTDLDIRIGNSDLKGSMQLDTAGERPRAEVLLTTEVLQLEDFLFEGWSMLDADTDAEPEQGAAVARGAGGVDPEQIATLLSRESMARIDAAFTLDVARVLLGKEELGSGKLGLTLDDGRLDVKPVRLDIPGGALSMSLAFEPTDEGVYGQIGFDVDHFDYGVLARRLKPGTDMGGHLSLNVALDSRADRPENLLRNANGHLLFGIWPEKIEADVFDLWTVNLLLAVLPTVNEGPKSKVNCIVAGLEFREGVAARKSLLLDTTNMQVGGDATANFKTGKIDVFLKPQAKVPQFFSLATPVRVDGEFSDFGVSPAPGALIGTVIRMATSIVTVPVERLFRENIPEDGEAACAIAYRGGIPEGR